MAQPAPSPLAACDDGAPPPPGWALDETPVPESTLHDQILLLVRLLWLAWLVREERAAYVAHNLALRFWAARPEVGLDPDLALYEPPPPRVAKLRSVRTWRPGHAPPKVALEVVSKNHPTKDYRLAPAKYDASGTGELWVFDPLLAGPREGGGPYRLQLWARGPGGRLERLYAGEGPVRSPFFGAWLVVVDEEEGGLRLRLSDDPKGRRRWPTPEEAERQAKEAERRAKAEAEARAEAERAAKEAERRAKEAAEQKAEAEQRAKDEALAELARLREEVARLREGKAG
ncbi:MAG TPA: Uma2 family endonuclease [Polyangiaceae bacterium]|nr:Uma2 family endonuclease [Polyangiaceae bacterium]